MESEHAGSPVEMVETEAPCVEVRILWGASTLQVAHLAPPRAFHLGESWARRCDFVLAAALLGALRAPLLLVDGHGSVTMVLLPRATGTLELPGEPPASLRETQARPYDAIAGAFEVPLPPGAKATVELGGLVFEVTNGRAVQAFAAPRRPARRALLLMCASFAAHALVLLAAAHAMPRLHELESGVAAEDQLYTFQTFTGTPGEPEEDEPRVEAVTRIHPDGEERANSRCGERHGGSMGDPGARETGLRHGVQGPADNADPHVARDARYHDGWIFALGPPWDGWAGGDRDAPTMAWGRDDSLGNDEASARGNAWGDSLGAAFGSPGIGVGTRRLCETCGAWGRGRDAGRTAPGGATGTESAATLAAR